MEENKCSNYNYGIALLKMLMCFEVILIHFWSEPSSILLTPFRILEEYAVPTFMFLSFYFSKNTFLTNDFSKAKKRFWKIIYPQIGWTVLYSIILISFQIRINLGISFYDFLWQLFTGHSPKINPSMWFQSVLITLTFIFTLLFKYLNKKRSMSLILFLTFASILIQHSGLNYKIFGSLRYELKYPLGRICEMIPYASTGFIIAYFDIYNRIKKKNTLVLTLFGFAILILLKNRYALPSAPGFNYSHTSNLILVFFLAGFAYLLPLEQISDKIKIIIHFITRFTLGIYCMHRLVAFVLSGGAQLLNLEVNSFILCLTIYLISFSTSLIICKISPRLFKPLVE